MVTIPPLPPADASPPLCSAPPIPAPLSDTATTVPPLILITPASSPDPIAAPVPVHFAVTTPPLIVIGFFWSLSFEEPIAALEEVVEVTTPPLIVIGPLVPLYPYPMPSAVTVPPLISTSAPSNLLHSC